MQTGNRQHGALPVLETLRALIAARKSHPLRRNQTLEQFTKATPVPSLADTSADAQNRREFPKRIEKKFF
jgi:hypothetical protein